MQVGIVKIGQKLAKGLRGGDSVKGLEIFNEMGLIEETNVQVQFVFSQALT